MSECEERECGFVDSLACIDDDEVSNNEVVVGHCGHPKRESSIHARLALANAMSCIT